MFRLTCLLLAPLAISCVADVPTEEVLAAEDVPTLVAGKLDATWDVAPTLHVGERIFDRAAQGGRRVYPVWLAGAAATPVTLDVIATATDDNDVRVAVLGPLANGTRPVLAAAGYGTPRANIEITVDATTSGEHLIVVGSHELATDTAFHVASYCRDCAAGATDVLASPKAGALVATGTGMVQAQLGNVLADRTFDVELELWASPPLRPWAATMVATAVASGNQVNVIVPPSVRAGDDLRLVLREAGGAVLDAGVAARFAPTAAPLVRTDALLYGDLVSVQAAGIVGFFEGRAELTMRSETRHLTIVETAVEVDRPGQVGNGFGAFDATFTPELEDPSGQLNPNLPHNGDVLSIGFENGNGDYRRLGCFEYCNDLSGMETCTGGTRTCPTTAW